MHNACILPAASGSSQGAMFAHGAWCTAGAVAFAHAPPFASTQLEYVLMSTLQVHDVEIFRAGMFDIHAYIDLLVLLCYSYQLPLQKT